MDARVILVSMLGGTCCTCHHRRYGRIVYDFCLYDFYAYQVSVRLRRPSVIRTVSVHLRRPSVIHTSLFVYDIHQLFAPWGLFICDIHQLFARVCLSMTSISYSHGVCSSTTWHSWSAVLTVNWSDSYSITVTYHTTDRSCMEVVLCRSFGAWPLPSSASTTNSVGE